MNSFHCAGVSGIGPAATGAAIGAAFTAIERFAQSHVWAQPNDGLHVVITGGSRGLGKALAREMLRAGDRVVITSRTQAAVDEAVRTLKEEVPGAQVTDQTVVIYFCGCFQLYLTVCTICS